MELHFVRDPREENELTDDLEEPEGFHGEVLRSIEAALEWTVNCLFWTHLRLKAVVGRSQAEDRVILCQGRFSEEGCLLSEKQYSVAVAAEMN